MRKFLRMIELINSRHAYIKDESLGGEFRILARNEIGVFSRILKDCRPFVFSDLGDVQNTETLETEVDHDYKLITGAPFKTFSIECQTQPLFNVGGGENRLVWCMLVHEVGPNDFIFIYYVQYQDVGEGVIINQSGAVLADYYLKQLSRQTTGIESVRHRIKIVDGDKKETHTFRSVIYVSPKKLQHTFGHRNIDWTHRWEVRGHWRKHNGIGKDRAGNYCVEGFTWVSECTKGPENAPLLSKTRIVKSEESITHTRSLEAST